jgi:hypothetical protein
LQPVISVLEKAQAASFAKAITQDEFGRFYWDDRRESEVRRSKGKEVHWVIEVIEVVPGWFSGYYIRGSASPTLAVSCELESTPTTKTIAEKISIGDKVVCSGKLGDPTMVLFGQAAVSVKGAAVTARKFLRLALAPSVAGRSA